MVKRYDAKTEDLTPMYYSKAFLTGQEKAPSLTCSMSSTGPLVAGGIEIDEHSRHVGS